MPAYSITQVAALDQTAAKRYEEFAQAAIAAYGGKLIVLGAEAEVAEGDWPEGMRVVVIEWSDMETVRTWYDSPEYAPARDIAATALKRNLVFLEGFQGAPVADSEKTVRRFYEAMNTGDTSDVHEFIVQDWLDTPLPPGTPEGIDGFIATVAYLRSAFPDLSVEIEDVVSSGDRVAVRLTATGTHQGEILGVAPTGRKVEFRAYDFHRLSDGMIVQSWHLEDFFTLRQQLGN